MQSDEASSGLYTVPYDFDFSVFVNAEYSRPSGIPVSFDIRQEEIQGDMLH